MGVGKRAWERMVEVGGARGGARKNYGNDMRTADHGKELTCKGNGPQRRGAD
jgi:hypothetical protein